MLNVCIDLKLSITSREKNLWLQDNIKNNYTDDHNAVKHSDVHVFSIKRSLRWLRIKQSSVQSIEMDINKKLFTVFVFHILIISTSLPELETRVPFYYSTYANCKVTQLFSTVITFKPLTMWKK